MTDRGPWTEKRLFMSLLFCVEAWRELFRMICFFQSNFCWRSSPGRFGLFYFEIPFSCGFAPITSIYHYLFCSHYPNMKSLYFMFEFYGHFPLLQKWQKATYLPLQLCLCMLFWKIVLFAKKWACFNKRFHCWVAIEEVICSSFIEICAINAIVSKPPKCIHLAVKDLPFLSCLNLVISCNSSNTKLHVLHFHLSGLLQFYNMQVTEKNLWQYWLSFSI